MIETLFNVLMPLLWSLPVWLVLLVGIVYAALTMQQHSEVSTYALVALGGFLLLDLAGTLVWVAYEQFVVARGAQAGVWMVNLFWFMQAVVHAGFLGLAIVAAWKGREVDPA